jgi:hypothetical protein
LLHNPPSRQHLRVVRSGMHAHQVEHAVKNNATATLCMRTRLAWLAAFYSSQPSARGLQHHITCSLLCTFPWLKPMLATSYALNFNNSKLVDHLTTLCTFCT